VRLGGRSCVYKGQCYMPNIAGADYVEHCRVTLVEFISIFEKPQRLSGVLGCSPYQ